MTMIEQPSSEEMALAPGVTMQPLEAAAPSAPRLHDSSMSGSSKAAILLVALGAGHAAEVFKYLKEDEIEALSLEMAQLEHVKPAENTDVSRE